MNWKTKRIGSEAQIVLKPLQIKRNRVLLFAILVGILGLGVIVGYFKQSPQPRLPETETTFIKDRYYWTDEQKIIIIDIIEMSELVGFDWKLVVAVAQLETQMGEKVVGRNNLFNIKSSADTYRHYSIYKESVLDFIRLLNTSRYYKEFQESGSVDDLFRYAEDPLWIPKVKSIMYNL